MDDKEIVKELVEATALEIYKDSAKPALRVVGKSLAQCISLFVTPLGRAASILEKNIHRYLDKLEGLKEGELISPDTRVLVPVLEKMRYTEDEVVANYYAEILASASKKESRGKVLLSFIEILNRITADEIKILEFINSNKNSVILDGALLTEEERTKFLLPNSKMSLNLGTALPIIDVRITTKGRPGFEVLLNNFNLLSDYVSLEFPENVDYYLDNLISLGLLHIPFGKSFAISPIYKVLKEHPKVKKIQEQLISGQELTFEEARVELTSLSLRMLAICKPQNT